MLSKGEKFSLTSTTHINLKKFTCLYDKNIHHYLQNIFDNIQNKVYKLF